MSATSRLPIRHTGAGCKRFRQTRRRQRRQPVNNLTLNYCRPQAIWTKCGFGIVFGAGCGLYGRNALRHTCRCKPTLTITLRRWHYLRACASSATLVLRINGHHPSNRVPSGALPGFHLELLQDARARTHSSSGWWRAAHGARLRLKVPVHISTQTSILNHEGGKLLGG